NSLDRVDRRWDPQIGVFMVHDVESVAANEVDPIQNLRIEATDVVGPVGDGVSGFAELADVVPKDCVSVVDGHQRLLAISDFGFRIADWDRGWVARPESSKGVVAPPSRLLCCYKLFDQ